MAAEAYASEVANDIRGQTHPLMQIHVAKRISAKFFLLLSEPDLTQVVLNFHALILSGMANKKPNSYAIQSTFSQCEFLASPVLRHIRLKQGWILQIKHIFHLTLVCLKNAHDTFIFDRDPLLRHISSV